MKNRIVVEIEDGLVQRVYSEDENIQVIIRDHDLEGSECDAAEEGSLYENSDGERYVEFEPDVLSWDELETQPYENPVTEENL